MIQQGPLLDDVLMVRLREQREDLLRESLYREIQKTLREECSFRQRIGKVLVEKGMALQRV